MYYHVSFSHCHHCNHIKESKRHKQVTLLTSQYTPGACWASAKSMKRQSVINLRKARWMGPGHAIRRPTALSVKFKTGCSASESLWFTRQQSVKYKDYLNTTRLPISCWQTHRSMHMHSETLLRSHTHTHTHTHKEFSAVSSIPVEPTQLWMWLQLYWQTAYSLWKIYFSLAVTLTLDLNHC